MVLWFPVGQQSGYISMCPLNWAMNEKELYFSDPLLVSHCCPVDIGGKGGQDQYEWWWCVTDPILPPWRSSSTP